jgi:hypothetical protein
MIDIDDDLRLNVYSICKHLEQLIEMSPFTRVIVLPLVSIHAQNKGLCTL